MRFWLHSDEYAHQIFSPFKIILCHNGLYIMKPEPRLAAFAKIERAKTQIKDVESRIQIWAQSNPYSVVSKINPHDPREEVWSLIPSDIGFDLPIIIGETLHNIRSPIDQVLAAVAEIGGSSDGVAFPFGKTADIFERAIAKQKKLLPADAIDMDPRAQAIQRRE
jgi:hypothetical protein